MSSIEKRKFFTNIYSLLSILLLGESLIYLFTRPQKIFDFFLDNFPAMWMLFLLSILYITALYLIKFIYKIVKHRRWDIIISFLYGIIFLFYFHWDNDFLYEFVALFPFLFLVSTYILFVLIFVTAKDIKKGEERDSLFLSDEAEEDKEKDVLHFKEDARIFADQVLNNFHPSSIVFGINAPWGSGKSTYINFCKKYWDTKDDVIIFDFEPLRFKKRLDLFGVFVSELITKVKKEYYAPELTFYLKQYGRLLQNLRFNFGFLEFALPLKFATSDDAFKNLKDYLIKVKKKIIVIIDDLDRLPLEDVKVILDVVKKSFVLPNMSFVLCYDTDNLNTFQSSPNIDKRKIVEYFEKVVNIKKTLVVPRGKLKDYMLKEIMESDKQYISHASKEKVQQAIDIIFDPQTFDKYSCYIGDLRKIKRFLNIFKLQILPELRRGLDISENDINFLDLFHLFLIYINYPNTFRTIYLNETDGGTGFFSLVIDYKKENNSGEFYYRNSEQYQSYIEKLTNDEEKWLLNKIFSEKKYNNASTPEKNILISTSALFNGTTLDFRQSGRNLENYLKMIVDGVEPYRGDEDTFHLKKATSCDDVATIFANTDVYRFEKDYNGEKYIASHFNVLTQNIEQVSYERAISYINYILDNLPTFSTINNSDLHIGLRDGLILDYLVYLLNRRGWKDSDKGRNNNKNNLVEIAKRIFGEGEFEGNGVLDRLSNNNRGILGVNDLLCFRLDCSQDRGGEFYNLYNAMHYHEDPGAQTQGIIAELVIQQMREISQKCFEVFKKQYIDSGKNIFEDINVLTEVELCGKSYEYVKGRMVMLSEEVAKIKNVITSFIVYQLSSNNVNLGVGCGIYDETGRDDGGGIRKMFNKYLFDVCFDPSVNIINSRYFVDYLLIDFIRQGIGSDAVFAPSFKSFIISLDQELLGGFWKMHGKTIKDYLAGEDRTIYTYNYTAFYARDLPNLFSLLDKELSI